jgi:MHS family shikimate/dehydroshikimate transporter-like MFS transporter
MTATSERRTDPAPLSIGIDEARTSRKAAQSSRTRRIAIASSVGAIIDWYDFFLYGTASAVVFGPLFFPSQGVSTELLAAFGTFAIGFLFRPVGGAVFGHFGDKVGRRAMLALTVIIMGVASALIGLLPTFSTVGIWAPIMLVTLRAVQGFAVGGEWGGAALMAVESAPKGRQNILSSGVQTGPFIGLLLGTAAFFGFQRYTTHAQFMDWGWRVPFLLSAVLAAVGLWIRSSLPESEEFEAIKEKNKIVRAPLMTVLKTCRKEILAVVGMRLLDQTPYYLAFTFSLAYVANYTKVPVGDVMIASMISMVIATVTLPMYARWADRVGIKWFYIVSSLVGAGAAYPFFLALESGSILWMTLGFFAMVNVCHNMSGAVQPVWFARIFDMKVRYSGAGFGYALAGAVGGFFPLIAAALVTHANGAWQPVAGFVAAVCLIGGLAGWWSYRWTVERADQ